MGARDIDSWRKFHLAVAEWIDAWRLIPRALVAGYGFMLTWIVVWYMKLEPYILEGCDISVLGEKCIINAPTGSQSILLSVVVGAAAAVFGLYTNTGRKWDKFIPWNDPTKDVRSPEDHSKE
jgi:hypothetical protein